MDGGGTDAAGDHALAELGEARRGVDLGAVLASVRVDSAGPEDLAEGAAAGPEDAVDDDGFPEEASLFALVELSLLVSEPRSRRLWSSSNREGCTAGLSRTAVDI